MTRWEVAKSTVIVALLWQAPTGADAMEPFGAPRSAGAVNNGLIAIAAQAPARSGARVRGGRNVQVNRPVKRNTQISPRPRANVDVNGNVHVSGHSAGQPRPGPVEPVSIPAAKPPVVAGGGWARPGWYRWTPGGAVTAGAALGFVTAATATWATSPRPGLCWYYTDPTQQDGFWDDCP